ncbi:cytochrome c [Aeromicrobium phragmitis]|uniref:Cytochrome c n=1 Tax=Aeromicrobium phragmitis TaxID=2478914 RepID=A0A3L8PLJ1_9ACTN|nr:cytochrome c [Aeromicrobium phragmitis]RLV56276.1 cytochrome c [Aeromicrobium phragmitis]
MISSRLPAAVVLALALAACGPDTGAETERIRTVEGGDAERGRAAVIAYGCASCHVVPDVDGVDDERVAPDLTDFADRDVIAGHVPNRPEELITWLRNPKDIAPGTLMPDLGVTEQDARDLAAFLYTQ